MKKLTKIILSGFPVGQPVVFRQTEKRIEQFMSINCFRLQYEVQLRDSYLRDFFSQKMPYFEWNGWEISILTHKKTKGIGYRKIKISGFFFQIFGV